MTKEQKNSMGAGTESQPFYMNQFVVKAFFPGRKVFSAKVYAKDKQGAKRCVWHCQPSAIIESVEVLSIY